MTCPKQLSSVTCILPERIVLRSERET